MNFDNKRKAPRFTLRLSGGAGAYTAGVADCGTADCELVDVSSGGLKGRLLTPDKLCPPLATGQEIELQSFASRQMDFLRGKTGVVAWLTPIGHEFGVRFHEDVDPDQVEAIIFHFSSFFG